jgi:hypothetical protein
VRAQRGSPLWPRTKKQKGGRGDLALPVALAATTPALQLLLLLLLLPGATAPASSALATAATTSAPSVLAVAVAPSALPASFSLEDALEESADTWRKSRARLPRPLQTRRRCRYARGRLLLFRPCPCSPSTADPTKTTADTAVRPHLLWHSQKKRPQHPTDHQNYRAPPCGSQAPGANPAPARVPLHVTKLTGVMWEVTGAFVRLCSAYFLSILPQQLPMESDHGEHLLYRNAVW